MATLYKRKDSPFWWMTWMVGGRKLRDSTGIRHEGKRTPPETAKQILRDLEDRLSRQRFGLEMPITQICVKDFFRSYSSTITGRDGTIAAKQVAIDKFVEWCGENGIRSVTDINRTAVCDYITARTAKGIMLSTVKVQCAILAGALDEAKRRNHIRFEENPFRVKIKTDSVEKEPFTREQVAAMLSMSAPQWVHIAMRVCLSTGARIGSVLSLMWEDVDLEACAIHFRKSKKGAYTVPMSDELVAYLRPLKRDVGAVFVEIAGMSGSYPANFFTRTVREQCGFDANWHRFRHTWVSAMQANGVPMRIAMTLADHTSESIHAGYSHTRATELRGYIKGISLFAS